MRWTMIVALLLFAAVLRADEPAKPAEAPKTDAPKVESEADKKAAAEQKAKDEAQAKDDLALTETKADLTEFLKKYLPGVDPAGAHDFTKIQNPTDPQKRFEYTHQMGRLLQFYVKQLDMGATFAKHFDALARTQLRDQPVFNTLHAMLLISFPPGRPNVLEAENLLKTAAKQGDNYEYPNYLLARIMSARLEQPGGGGDARAMMDLVDRCIKMRPAFVDAKLLKAEILLAPNGDPGQAVRILDEVLAMDLTDVEDFVQALSLYAEATTVEQLLPKIEDIVKRPNTDTRRCAHARAVAAQVLARAGKIRESLPWMDAALAGLTTEQDPRFSIIARHFMGKANADLALDLRRRDPKLSGENRKAYETLVLTAKKYYELAATLEQQLMPADLRGENAEYYVIFLDASLEEPETAIKWLEAYLNETTISGNWRTRLEAVLLALRARNSGDELEFAKQVRSSREKQDTEGLMKSLALLGERTRKGNTPKTGELLKELLENLNYTDRNVVALSALLAAETAVGRGGDDPKTTGEAIARRLEKESECTNDEQAQLHKRLAQAIQRLSLRKFEARAVRHLGKLFEGVTATRTPDDLFNVLFEWNDEAYLENVGKAIKDSHVTVPEKLTTSAQRKPATVRTFLADLSKALDKAGEKEN